MQEDFYQYYGTAPVMAWVVRAEIADGIKSLVGGGHKIIKYKDNSEEEKARAILKAGNWCKGIYFAKMHADVKKAF